jgi:hypothetical protein
MAARIARAKVEPVGPFYSGSSCVSTPSTCSSGAITHNETGGGYFLALLKGDVRTWVSGFPFGFSQFYVGLAKLLAVQGS